MIRYKGVENVNTYLIETINVAHLSIEIEKKCRNREIVDVKFLGKNEARYYEFLVFYKF